MSVELKAARQEICGTVHSLDQPEAAAKPTASAGTTASDRCAALSTVRFSHLAHLARVAQ